MKILPDENIPVKIQTELEKVLKQKLIESLFTMHKPEGIRGIFNQKEIDKILSLTEQILVS